jgi:hypothetical protein
LGPFWLWRHQILLRYAPSGVNYMHKIEEWATERCARASITILALAASNTIKICPLWGQLYAQD